MAATSSDAFESPSVRRVDSNSSIDAVRMDPNAMTCGGEDNGAGVR